MKMLKAADFDEALQAFREEDFDTAVAPFAREQGEILEFITELGGELTVYRKFGIPEFPCTPLRRVSRRSVSMSEIPADWNRRRMTTWNLPAFRHQEPSLRSLAAGWPLAGHYAAPPWGVGKTAKKIWKSQGQ